MKNRLGSFLLLLLSMLWIAGTLYRPAGMNQIGALLSVNSGPLGMGNPDYESGTIELTGHDPYSVTIKIDSFGVPHVFGATEKDVSYGLGYQTAYDRYFQMELMTRMVQGRLCELIGEKGFALDSFWCRYRLEEQAQRIYASYATSEPGLHASIAAYGDGVRAYLSEHNDGDRLFEYNLIGESPREWKDHYVLLLPYYMSYILTYNDLHAQRVDVLQKVPPKMIQELYTNINKDYPLIHPYLDVYRDDTVIYPTDTIVKLLEFTEGVVFAKPRRIPLHEQEMRNSIGSNNWAVSPMRTVKGNALLCNDPHLDLTLPGPWYEAHLVCDSFNTYGFTIPCSPAIVSGHNQSIAWGITNAYWDLIDRYVLKVNETGDAYYLKDKWVPFETDTITVAINGKKDRTLTVRKTVHGIVEQDAAGTWFAVKWHGANDNHSAITFRELAMADDIDGFVKALDHFNYPPQNFAYADVQGNIGVMSAGDMPVKPDDFDGGYLDGTKKPVYKYVPTAKLPYTFNPPEGFVVSANQQPERTNRYINHSYPEPYRGQRIREMLQANDHHSVYSMQRIQGDVVDLSAQDFREVFEPYANKLKDFDFVVPVLEWDGSMRADLHVPLRYTLLKHTLYEQFSNELYRGYGVYASPNYSNMLRYLAAHDTLVFGENRLFTSQLLEDVIFLSQRKVDSTWGREAFESVLYEEESAFTINHIMRLKGLEMKLPKDGSANTPNVNSYGKHASSMRTIIELGTTVQSWTILGGGQSGRLHSAHFNDQVAPWDNMQYRKSNVSPDPEKHTSTVSTLILK